MFTVCDMEIRMNLNPVVRVLNAGVAMQGDIVAK
jgi:hypothetical protein